VLVKVDLVVGISSRRIASASAGAYPAEPVHARRKARQAKASFAAVVLEANEGPKDVRVKRPVPNAGHGVVVENGGARNRRSRIVQARYQNLTVLVVVWANAIEPANSSAAIDIQRGEVPPPRKAASASAESAAWLTILASTSALPSVANRVARLQRKNSLVS